MKLLKYVDKNHKYIKVNILNESYYLQTYKEELLLDHTSYTHPNTGNDLLPRWTLNTLDINGVKNNSSFFKSTNLHTPSSKTGMYESLKIRMFIESSSPNFSIDNSTFCSMERNDLSNVKHIYFRYGRYSDSSDSHPKVMLRMDIDIINNDQTYTTITSIEENTTYSQTWHNQGWLTMNLPISDDNKGVRFNFTQISQANCDMDIQDNYIYYEF